MSIRQGKKLIASSTTNGFNLFDCKWADHILNNISWLRADTFSWQSGDVYVAAYNHLAEEFASVTEWSFETVGGVYIGYKLMPDGHKITDASSEQYVQAIYEATGVAWYYILDTTNRQFKLPRTKWGFTGIRSGVGGYVAQEVLLPNITGYASFSANGSTNYLSGVVNTGGALYGTTDVSSSSGGGGGNNHSGAKRLRLDASRSSSVYSGNGTNTLIQPPATQMYLYFYVGNFEQSAIEQTAGLNTELFNNKADLNLMNITNGAKEIMATASMPSGTYRDLTLGSSGSTYTAPADGWFYLMKNAGVSVAWISLENKTGKIVTNQAAPGNANSMANYIPAKSGDTVAVTYSATGTTSAFRFIYAEGAKHLKVSGGSTPEKT